MALAETAELAVRLTLDDRMSPAIRKAQGGLRTLGNTAKTVGKGIAIGVGAAATVGIVALTGAIKSGIEALKADKVVAAQTAAVIKSTGGAAGVTAGAVADLADKLSILDGVQDDVVQGAENVILRFTNIGSDIFPAVTQAALDMAAATGTDAASSALKLSRALDNPVKSLGALTRLGIVFTDQQKKQIEGLVASNRLREAQAIVLGVVETKFKGVAEAQANADPSKRLAVSTERFQKALASGLLPVIEKVQTRLSEWLIKPSTIEAVRKIGDAIGGLFTDQNLDAVASGLETAAKAVSVAISAFNALPAPIKALAIGAFAINKVTGGAVTGVVGTLGKIIGAGIGKIFAANVTVIGANVTTPGIPGIGGAAGTGESLASGGIKAAVLGFIGSAGFAAIVAAGLGVATVLAINEIEKDKNLKITSGGKTAFGRFGAIGTPVSGVGRDKPGVGLSVIGKDIRAMTTRIASGIKLPGLEAKLDKNIDKLGHLQAQLHKAQESGDTQRTQRLQARIDRTNQRVDAAKQGITSATVQARDAARHAGITTTSAENAGANAIVAAIYAAVPNISLFVTASNVSAAITQHHRAGPTNGSAAGSRTRSGGSGGPGSGGGARPD